MPIVANTLSLLPPISEAELPSLHPVLGFYVKYSFDFFHHLNSTDGNLYYAGNATMTFTDGTTLQGAPGIWKFYRQIYGTFEKDTAEVLSVHLVSDDDNVAHILHIELVRKLSGPDGGTVFEVPQYFVYTIGKANAGEGTDGLQIKKLKVYYDYSVLKSAAAAVGDNVEKWKTVDIGV